MSNANKNKGKGWERELAKHLSKVTGKSFTRVPNSGAFVGGKNFFRTETLSKEQIGMFEGDLITPKEWDHVRFECKFYKKMAWAKLFAPEGESQMNKWIEQVSQGTRPYWFLCFKINNIGRFVLFLDNVKYIYQNSLYYFIPPKTDNISTTHYPPCKIVSMDTFFELNKDIIEGLKNDTDNRN